MTERASLVTDVDVALLRSVARERSVVAASRALEMPRDRAVYRIARLARAFGGPVVLAARGGRSHGGTRLTELGDRIVRGGFDSVELLAARPVAPPSRSNRMVGVYHGTPGPTVVVAGRLRLRVTFAAEEGEPVSLLLDPEAILVALGKFPSSARNVLRATVTRVEPETPGGGAALQVRVGPLALRVAVTAETVRQLRVRAGGRLWLYVKATALRRVAPAPARPTRGSPRSRARRPPRLRAGSANR
jgi:molybdate transport repressor ModE-like protein/molybdopterin-binding protein